MSPSSIDLKIVVLGPAGVGKTCVIHRFCNGAFLTNTLATIGAGFFPHTMQIGQTDVNMMLWDTAGEERFRSVAPSLLRGANGLVLVYDCTDLNSFNELEIYLNIFLDTAQYDPNLPLPILVLGNKSDIVDVPKIPEETVQNWLTRKNIVHHFRVSAKSGENIESSFTTFISDFLKTAPSVAPASIQIDVGQPQQEEKKGCCK